MAETSGRPLSSMVAGVVGVVESAAGVTPVVSRDRCHGGLRPDLEEWAAFVRFERRADRETTERLLLEREAGMHRALRLPADLRSGVGSIDSFQTVAPQWRPGDTIPLGSGRALSVVGVRVTAADESRY